MASNKPRWREVFDAAEHAVTPRADALVRRSEFSKGAAVVAHARAVTRHGLAAISSRAWHVVNLPAGTDLRRLRFQIGEIDRELRRLSMRLDQAPGAGEEPGPAAEPGPPR